MKTNEPVSNADINKLIEELSNSDANKRKKAAESLWTLSQGISVTNREIIIQANGIELLVRLIGDTDNFVRLYAVAILGNVALNNFEVQAKIIQKGVIAPLIQVLEDGLSLTRQLAAALFWILAQNVDNRIEIARLGAIAPLVRRLSDGDSTVRKQVAEALRNLSAGNKENRAEIGQKGGILPLVMLLDDADVSHDAAAALFNLSSNTANQIVMMKPESIQSLVQLLDSSSAETRKYSAGILVNLLGNTVNQIPIVQAGVIELFIRRLAVDENSEVKSAALSALSILAGNEKMSHKMTMAQEGAIPPIINLLSDANTTVRKKAAGILFVIACNNHLCQKLILRENALPILEEMAKTETDPTTKQFAKQFLEFNQSMIELSKQQTKGTASKLDPSPLKTPAVSTPQTVAVSSIVVSVSQPDARSSAAPTVTALDHIPSNELVIQEELGRGGFGVVCEGLWQGVKVAIKQLTCTHLPKNILHEFMHEAEIHGGLRHPHIVALYGVCLEKFKYALVMELMTNGSLYDILHNEQDLPWLQRNQIALDVTAGLLFLHGREILHRDLKSLNVLLDNNGRAKLSDFGLSKVKTHTSATTKGSGAVGTLYWMAPELFNIDGVCNKKTDVYALGMLLWEIASRKLPYKSAHGNQEIIIHWIKDGTRESIPEQTPPPFAELISQCWSQRAMDRPETQQVSDALMDDKSDHVSSGYLAFSHSSGSVI